MNTKNPIEQIYKHHRGVEKSIASLEELIEQLESQGLDAFHDHYPHIQKIRHTIKTDFEVYFRTEQEVIFPVLEQYIPDAKSSIINFTERNEEVKNILDHIVTAIDNEDVETLVDEIQAACDSILILVSEKDAFYNDLAPDIIPPTEYQEINHRMNVIKEAILEQEA